MSLGRWRPQTFGNLSGSPNHPSLTDAGSGLWGTWRAGWWEQTVNLVPVPVAPKIPALAAENRPVRTAAARNIKGFTLKHYLAKVGVEGSNPFARSSPLRTKLSPPFSGPPKSPTAAGIRASGLGVRERNDTVNRSPNADLSPKLGAWPIYSTSFFR